MSLPIVTLFMLIPLAFGAGMMFAGTIIDWTPTPYSKKTIADRIFNIARPVVILSLGAGIGAAVIFVVNH